MNLDYFLGNKVTENLPPLKKYLKHTDLTQGELLNVIKHFQDDDKFYSNGVLDWVKCEEFFKNKLFIKDAEL